MRRDGLHLERYDAAAWSPLVNACRQPRAAYRWALLVPGAASLDGLPGAGAAGRWFLLPCGALLLRREPGRLVGLHDLAARPLRVGPFTLALMAPISEATAQRRAKLREVRAARRTARGTPCPAPVAVPNEGRPFRFGPRLVLAVSGKFLKARRREVVALGLRETGAKGRPAGFAPSWLAEELNRRTAELEAVAAFAWCDAATLRAWDKTTRGVMVAALVRSGWKGRPARAWTAQHVRPWERSRPSQAARRANDRGRAADL